MANLEKKWKSLVHRISYLRFELDDRKEKISKFESEINNKVASIAPEVISEQENEEKKENSVSLDGSDPRVKIESEEKSEDSSREEKLVDSSPKHEYDAFKKLWKQIAIKTHPDRNGGSHELTAAYVRALDAWNKGEIEILIEVALDIELKITDPTQEMIDILDTRAQKLEEEIRRSESNLVWAWGHAAEDKQSLIIDELLRYKRSKYRV